MTILKTVRSTVLAVPFLVLSSTSVYAADAANNAVNNIVAKIQNLQGQAIITRGERSFPAKEGLWVAATDRIQMSQGSKATLVYGRCLRVQNGTTRIKKPASCSMNMPRNIKNTAVVLRASGNTGRTSFGVGSHMREGQRIPGMANARYTLDYGNCERGVGYRRGGEKIVVGRLRCGGAAFPAARAVAAPVASTAGVGGATLSTGMLAAGLGGVAILAAAGGGGGSDTPVSQTP
jgi:hypothetical protein